MKIFSQRHLPFGKIWINKYEKALFKYKVNPAISTKFNE